MVLAPVLLHESDNNRSPDLHRTGVGFDYSTPMYANPAITRRLPAEEQMDRDDALDAFVAVVNTVQPDHPDFGNPWPIEASEVEFGVTRSCYARCGPRAGITKRVGYKTRMTYINEISRERHLALLVHEITHIPINNADGKEHGVHPREFWLEMAFHALELRDALQDGVLEPVFGEVDVDEYLRHVAQDPNGATVDQRYWTVSECRDRMRDLLGLE